MIQIDEGLKWDGQITFSVIPENESHLLSNIPRLIHQINSGNISFLQQIKQKNKVTNYARQTIASLLTGGPIILPSQIELGTGTGTASATDTNLWAPSTNTIKNLAYAQTYLTYFSQFVATWQTSDPTVGNWTECGLFDSSGGLWAHASISPTLSITSGTILVAQWQVQILSS